MRTFFLSMMGALIVASASADPIKYSVYVKDQKTGSLVSETSGDDVNGYLDETTMTTGQADAKQTVHLMVRYGKDGVATSRSAEMGEGDQSVKIKAVLSDDGAKVSVNMSDEKSEKVIALATKTSRADLTNFWFKKVNPKEGDAVVYQGFNIFDLKWEDVTLKFVGKVKVTVGDAEVTANEIDRTSSDDTTEKIYVDDKGDAVLIVDGEMRIVRQF